MSYGTTVLIDHAAEKVDRTRLRLRKLAALRTVQEGRAQSVCNKGYKTAVFPSDEIPAGWREHDRIDLESPDLLQLVNTAYGNL